MNKGELIDAVAAKIEGNKKDANEAVAAVLDVIQAAVASGDKVSIPGFGSFELVHRPERDGRNPSTGETIRIAESWTAKFKPASGFVAAVTGKQKTAA